MATIEQLNFELILNDKAFNDSIDAVIAKANSMNTDVSSVLDNLNKIASGGAVSQSKKNQILVGLKTQIKETEAEIASLQQKLDLFARNANMNGQGGFASSAVDKKFMEMSQRADELRQKLELLRKTYKDLGGDVALGKSFPFAPSKENNQELELLGQQLKEQDRHYKEIDKSIKSAANSQRRLTQETERGVEVSKKQSRLWRDMKNVALAYFSFEGARRLVSNLIQVSAEFEKQRVSLHAILQDAAGAEKIFGQIKELAVQSPFQFKELVTYTKQLSAFSIPMNELYDTTKMLADVSAGLGVGMDRLVLAYGQIRSASFLRGQEVRQLTEAGIPILEELRKQFEELGEAGITAGDVFDKISKRQVTFQMVEKVFKDMTSEGGKFYKMQEVLAETLSGKISNLKDAYQIMFAEIGEKSSGVLYKSVDAVRSLAENYERVGKAIASVAAVYGSYRVFAGLGSFATAWGKASAMAIIADGTLASGAKSAAAGLAGLIKQTKLYQAANKALLATNPYAVLGAAVVAVGLGIYTLTKRTNEYNRATEEAHKVVSDYNRDLDKEMGNLDYLFNRLRGLNAESDEYKRIKDELISQYGDYLTAVDKENLRIKNLSGVYDHLAASIKNASMEKAIAAGREKIAEFESGITSKVWTQMSEAFEAQGLDMAKGVGKELRDYMIGLTSGDTLSQAAIEAGKKIQTWAKWKNQFSRSNMDILLGQNKFYDVFESRQELAHMREQSKEMGKILGEQLDFYDKALDNTGNNLDKTLEGWKKDLADIAKAAEDAGAMLEINVDASSELLEVRQQLDKEMKESQEHYDAAMAAGEKGEAAIWKTRMGYLDQMRSRLGVKGEGSVTSNVLGASDEQTKNIVDNIQEQIRVYQMLQDAYEELVETVGDENARKFMAFLYPQYGDMAVANYADKIHELSDELLSLGLSSKDAADAWLDLQDTFSDEQYNAIIKSAQATKKYTEEIQKLIDEGYQLNGSGISYDISKNLLDLSTKNAATSRYYEGLKAAINEQEKAYKENIEGTEEEREAMWQEYKVKQIHLLDDLMRHELANNHKAVQEKIKDLAQTYVREMYRTNADGRIELNDWADKSMEQIRWIGSEIRDLIKNGLQIDDDVQKDADNLVVTFDELWEEIIKIFTADLGTQTQEQLKRLGTIASNVSSLVGKMGSSLSSLGDKINDDILKGWGETLDVVTEVAGAITECEPLMAALSSTSDDAAKNMENVFKSADWITMIIKLVGIGLTQIVKQVEKHYDKQIKIAEAAKEYQKTLNEIALAKYDGVLGVDDMGKLAQYYKQMADASSKWAKTVDDLRKWPDITAYLLSMLETAGYDLKTLDVNQLKELSAALKQMEAQSGSAYATMLIEQIDDYIEKLEGYENAISDIFSNVADDIVDNLVSAFDELGDSVADIEGAFYDLGDTILRSVLRSMVLENIVEKYKNDFMKAVTEYSLTDQTANDATALAAQLGNITSHLREELETSGGIFNAIIEAFRDAGLVDYNMDSEAKSTLGGGIQSITEDTANLLASYINGIRADVAAIRQAVTAQAGMTTPAPTLAEYLTQIQANTYNTAQNTADLLADLRSMMTVTDGPALRVFM